MPAIRSQGLALVVPVGVDHADGRSCEIDDEFADANAYRAKVNLGMRVGSDGA